MECRVDIREALLRATNLPGEWVSLPELGDGARVYVEGLPTGKKEEISGACTTRKNGKQRFDTGKFNRLLVVHCSLREPGGERVFTEGDLKALAEVRSDVIDRITTAAIRLNRLGQDDDEPEDDSPNPSTPAGA